MDGVQSPAELRWIKEGSSFRSVGVRSGQVRSKHLAVCIKQSGLVSSRVIELPKVGLPSMVSG